MHSLPSIWVSGTYVHGHGIDKVDRTAYSEDLPGNIVHHWIVGIEVFGEYNNCKISIVGCRIDVSNFDIARHVA